MPLASWAQGEVWVVSFTRTRQREPNLELSREEQTGVSKTSICRGNRGGWVSLWARPWMGQGRELWPRKGQQAGQSQRPPLSGEAGGTGWLQKTSFRRKAITLAGKGCLTKNLCDIHALSPLRRLPRARGAAIPEPTSTRYGLWPLP